ncbi:beta-galactosidase [Romboutsia weinsteinii]|uniref:Beta-galactosidase n=1 Tax=Romboutsia weinsteinii TaxID=2020949 RepID=A0A371J9P6_9FIRM|nr:beta-galactosidase family protein [Romboutsia weinsteinii]RDY29388.1 beta-galactosidase [Romboutsia weinsteinii]
MNKFHIRDDFYINDNKIKIISGALHYFRVVPEYWVDRLEKLKALGCNTVETYIPWNLHEPKEGVFDFEGQKDFVKFTKLAQDMGLYVILRPTPYICAEWEFGGLPAWLLKYPYVRVRSNCNIFLSAVDRYFNKLFDYIKPLQITQGGPVLMMQVENEYGSFSNNKNYLKNIKNLMIKHGCEVPLFTSDGGWKEVLEAGTLVDEGVLPTANFGSRSKEQIGALSDFMKENDIVGPLMCMEFWIGWFNNWGGEFKRRDAEDAANELKDLLYIGHVNIYMYHGGTNFGFYNGCSYHDGIDPQTTTYDYDALLNEYGEFTEKYYKFKDVISNFTEIPEVKFTTDIKKINYGEFKLTNKVSLFSTLDTLAKPIYNENTLNMEAIDQGYGYILYRANVGKRNTLERFKLIGMDDRAQIFVNENHHSTLYKENFIGTNQPISLDKEDDNIMDILVENLGRINYGGSLLSPSQRKGIKGGVMFDLHLHTGWDHYSLELDNVDKVNFSGYYKENTPAFYEYEFEVDEKGDTFLSTEGFGKGCAFINGFNLGRFWELGPTNYLYIPAPLLKEGLNKIVIFETEGKYKQTITLDDKPCYTK